MLKKLKAQFNFSLKNFVLVFLCFSFLFFVSFLTLNISNKFQKEVSINANSLEGILDDSSLFNEDRINYGYIEEEFAVETSGVNLAQSYEFLSSANDELPEEYSLYYTRTIYNAFENENKENFANLPKNVGNQKGTNICWTFATLTALESTLYKLGIVDTSANLNFSELNLSYTAQVLNHGLQTIGGGTFDLAYEYLSYGQGPVYEQTNEKNIFSSNTNNADQSTQNLYANYYLNSAKKAPFSALEAYTYPGRSLLTISQISLLRNSIKNHIYTYGAVTSSIAYSSSYFVTSSSPYYFYNPNSGDISNHLITLVGWDDNFSISYGGQTLTGAYIAQNSWGEDWGNNGYFYIMYDDAQVEERVSGFVRLENSLSNSVVYNNFEGTEYENNFISVTDESTYIQYLEPSSNLIIANFFDREDISGQYISRIQVPTVLSTNHKLTNFYVYVLESIPNSYLLTENSIKSYLASYYNSARKVANKYATGSDRYLFTSSQDVFYTIELDEQINLSNNSFGIIVKYASGPVYYRDNASAFSSISSRQKSYMSSNGLSWSKLQDGKEILPMIVQTSYTLGDIEYSVGNVLKTYDGNNAEFNLQVLNLNSNEYTISYRLENEDDFSENLTIKNWAPSGYRVFYKIDAPFYNTVVGDDKYFDVTIEKRQLTIEPLSQYKSYGDEDAIFDILPLVSGVKGEKPKYFGALTRQQGENVGKYKILYDENEFYLVDNGDFLASNYTINFVENVEYEIVPRTLYVLPEEVSKTYGEADPTGGYGYFIYNFVNNEIPNVSGGIIRGSGEDVGDYNFVINPQDPVTLYDNDNYNFKEKNYTLYLIPDNQAFHILPRKIYVTPKSNQQKVYNSSIEEVFDFTYTGTVNGEEAAFYGRLTREAGEDVGEYAITYDSSQFYLVDNGSFKANNYEIEFVEGVMFTITYGSLTGCVFEDETVFYDGYNHHLQGYNNVIQNVSVKYGLEADGEFFVSQIQYKNVGVYEIFAKFECANYTPAILSATLKIDKANLVVTPRENQSKIYDAEDEVEILFDVSGCADEETATFDGSLSLQNGSKDAKSYLITSGNLVMKSSDYFDINNYNFMFDNSGNITFEILKKDIVVRPVAGQYKFYGQENGVLDIVIEDLIEGEVPNVLGALSRTSGENVGVYEINAGNLVLVNSETFDINNYNVEFNTFLSYYTIKKAKITLKVNDVNCYYGEEASFGYTIIDDNLEDGTYKEGDDLGVSYSCEVTRNTKKDDRNVDYTIYASYHNDNYDIIVVKGLYNVVYKKYPIHFKILQNVITVDDIEHFSYVSEDKLPNTNLPGYIFKGWKIETTDENGLPTGSYKAYVYNVDYIEKETTVVADMEEEIYVAKFYTNSAEVEDYQISYTVNSFDYLLDTPYKTGYNFVGWFESADFSAESVSKILKGSTGDKNFYAKWQIKTYKVSVLGQTDNFEIECDEKYQIQNEIQVEHGGSFEFKVKLQKAYSKSDIVVSYKLASDDEFVVITKDSKTNLYKVLDVEGEINILVDGITLNSYIVNFVIDGEIVKSVTKMHGEVLGYSEYPEIPEKKHYDFVAPTWDMTQIESVEEDKDVTAKYTPNVYNVSFVISGQVYDTTVRYGESVSDEVLKENLSLNMFEYFDFDTNLNGIGEDTVIKVTIKSNIYILYIVLSAIGVVILGVAVALIVRRKKKNKLGSWWAYVKNPDESIKKRGKK